MTGVHRIIDVPDSEDNAGPRLCNVAVQSRGGVLVGSVSDFTGLMSLAF